MPWLADRTALRRAAGSLIVRAIEGASVSWRWGCAAATFTLDVNGLPTAAALTDGDRDGDAARMCEAFVSWEMNADAVHTGTFRLDFNELAVDQSRSYMVAISSDGVSWAQLGACARDQARAACMAPHVRSPRGGCLLTKGFEIDPLGQKFKYMGISTPCWENNLREVAFLPFAGA